MAISRQKQSCPTTRRSLIAHLPRVCASRNTIETVSLSRRNNCHANVCAPVELAPSRQATNGQRRYSCRARRSRYPPGLTRERKYDYACPNLRSLWLTVRRWEPILVVHEV